MKILIQIFILGALFLLQGCIKNEVPNNKIEKEVPNSNAELPDFKVMTYNIHMANPPFSGDKRDLPAIAKVINEAKPDFVALQEVDYNTERSGNDIHQAQALGKLTEMNFYFVKAMDVFGGGEYGIALLSKYPIIEAKGYELPSDPNVGGETRALGIIKISLPNGRKINFAGTHLDHKSEQNRIYQGKILNNILQSEDFPVILAGDFNAGPRSITLDFFENDYNRTCRHNCPPTFPAVTPKSAIDFIMYRKKDNISVVSHKVIHETYASDHLPVIAGLKLE